MHSNLKPQAQLEITGERYGSLVVTGYAGRNKHGRSIWHVVCDCGKTKIVGGSTLRSGLTKSCGCLQYKVPNVRNTQHRQSADYTTTPIYRSWTSMKNRCSNPKNPAYKYYGARGIKVCERWENSFEAFAEDMGPRPPGKSIDRINNDGNYEPNNCRWATQKEQVANQRKKGTALIASK